MEGLTLRYQIMWSRYMWMARMPGLIPTRALAQGAEAPVVLRSDLAIRKVLDTGGQGVRLAVDPVTQTLYDLDGQGNVSRVDLPPTGAATRRSSIRGPRSARPSGPWAWPLARMAAMSM